MFSVVLLVLTGFTLAADESTQLREPIDEHNDQDKSTDRNFESFNDPGKSKGGSFGAKALGKGPYGKQGLYPDDLLKSNAPAFETSVQREIRQFIRDTDIAILSASDAERSAVRARTSGKDGITCEFPGDPVPHTKAYCDAIFDTMNPTTTFYHIITNASITPNGNGYVVDVNYHSIGTVPLLGVDVNAHSDAELYISKNKDGEWEFTKIIFVGDNSDGLFARFRDRMMTELRDSIYSSKQNYPAYNPLVVVGGSAITALFGLVIASLRFPEIRGRFHRCLLSGI